MLLHPVLCCLSYLFLRKNMSTRYFVYDITSTMEDFVASYASKPDAESFAKQKFGDNGIVFDVALHDKIKVGFAKPRKAKRR